MNDHHTVGAIDPDTGRFKGVPEDHVVREMEAAGQQALLDSTLLPISVDGYKGKWGDNPETGGFLRQTDEDIEALGIVLGEPVDDLFRNAVLPPGWSKETSGTYWTYLLDETGKRRVAVGYKAAPYDRWALMRLALEDDDV